MLLRPARWLWPPLIPLFVKKGERGVCYYCDANATTPLRIIFENGGYDGFSLEDAKRMVEFTGQDCPEVVDYRYTSVHKLAADFRKGTFNTAFPESQNSERKL